MPAEAIAFKAAPGQRSPGPYATVSAGTNANPKQQGRSTFEAARPWHESARNSFHDSLTSLLAALGQRGFCGNT